MTNQFDYDLNLQATDLRHQPLEVVDEELKGATGGIFPALVQGILLAARTYQRYKIAEEVVDMGLKAREASLNANNAA